MTRVIDYSIGPSVSLNYEDWVGILKLSTMWMFTEVSSATRTLQSSQIKILILDLAP